MKYLTALIILTSYSFSFSQDCTENLKSSLTKIHGKKIINFESTYSCETASSCIVSFEYDNHPYPNSIIKAYGDSERKILLDWIVEGSENWIGWTPSGKYWCADVNTYAKLYDRGEVIDAEITKITAYDTMFCPARKLFFEYQTSCVRN